MYLPYFESADFGSLQGQTLLRVELIDDHRDQVLAFATNQALYLMYHQQSCCESVRLEDVPDNLSAVHGVVMSAYETTKRDTATEENTGGSAQWTFYNLSAGESLNLRWYGESNGYYSVDVDFCVVTPEEFGELPDELRELAELVRGAL